MYFLPLRHICKLSVLWRCHRAVFSLSSPSVPTCTSIVCNYFYGVSILSIFWFLPHVIRSHWSRFFSGHSYSKFHLLWVVRKLWAFISVGWCWIGRVLSQLFLVVLIFFHRLSLLENFFEQNSFLLITTIFFSVLLNMICARK